MAYNADTHMIIKYVDFIMKTVIAYEKLLEPHHFS